MVNRELSATGLVTALLITAATGCVSAPTVERATAPPTGNQAAELIDCDDFPSPEPDPREDFVIVTVPVDVASDGGVERVGTPRAGRAPHNQQVLDRAVSLARSCVFEPALRDGLQVSDRVEVAFRLGLHG